MEVVLEHMAKMDLVVVVVLEMGKQVQVDLDYNLVDLEFLLDIQLLVFPCLSHIDCCCCCYP